VVEDFDMRTAAFTDPELPDWAEVHFTMIEVLSKVGLDLLTGSRLVHLLRSSGLRDVRAEGSVRSMSIPELAPAFLPALERLRPLLDGGIAAERVDRTIDTFTRTNGDLPTAYTPMLVSVAGRR